MPHRNDMGACIRSLRQRPSSAIVEDNNRSPTVKSSRPPCGLKAKSILIEKKTDCSPKALHTNTGADQFNKKRSSADQFVNDSEAYDEPWDSKPIADKILQARGLVLIDQDRNMDSSTRKSRLLMHISSNEKECDGIGDSNPLHTDATYDEPWDSKSNRLFVNQLIETAFYSKADNPILRRNSLQQQELEQKIQQVCYDLPPEEDSISHDKLSVAQKINRFSNARGALRDSSNRSPVTSHSRITPPLSNNAPVAMIRTHLKQNSHVLPHHNKTNVTPDRRKKCASPRDFVMNASPPPVATSNHGTPRRMPSDWQSETVRAEDVHALRHGASSSSSRSSKPSPPLPATPPPLRQPLGIDRNTLKLDFGCAGLNPIAQKIDPSIILEKQSWYHGAITRAEAEVKLYKQKEGSYLVRLSESGKEEFALSLKSAQGFMHMKIQQTQNGKWVLGYFSHPFDSVPQMIRYYSVNKLPIKGAEHMCLLYPMPDQLL